MPNLALFIPSLPTLDLTGVFDILLVAFVVYEALMVVSQVRAFRGRGERPAFGTCRFAGSTRFLSRRRGD